MGDLELDKFGLEFRNTDVGYCKSFLDGTNVYLANDPTATYESWARHSQKDAELILRSAEMLEEAGPSIPGITQKFLYSAPTAENRKPLADLLEKFFQRAGVDLTFNQLWEMNGFDFADLHK